VIFRWSCGRLGSAWGGRAFPDGRCYD
jgi:hypothetical protein